jgi:oligopeptide transport system ATP-binding protein
MAEKVLEVKDLRVSFKTDHGIVKAVRGVSFDLYKGETLCIVGESGSGKSVSSKAIMGILANNAIVENGTIMYEGENLLEVSEEEYVNIRGHKIGMIFQDPLSSLNPIMRIGKQITEATLLNGNKLKKLYLDSINNENVAYKNLVTFKKVKTEKIKTKLAEDILTIRSGEKIQANK